MRILFLIRSLERGGAERQLATLAAALHRRGHEVAIAVFYGDGALAARLAEVGVPIHDLGKRGRWDLLRFLWSFRRVVRDTAPDVLHGYMPTANLICLLGRPALPPGGRVVWGVRSAFMDLQRYDIVARLTYWLERRLAGCADRIIVNSREGAGRLAAAGVPEQRLRVVPNGIDTGQFAPDSAGRARMRRHWGIGAEATLIGLVARLDPMKGHDDFLAAAALPASRRPGIRFVCIGGGDQALAGQLRQRAAGLGLSERLTWVGEVDDMPAAYAALDVAVNCSRGEGFSNAIAEAMACGCPCVVTDVGDSAWIVGQTGEVVPPSRPDALADGWMRMIARLETDAPALQAAVRERIVERFSIDSLAEATLRALHFEETA